MTTLAVFLLIIGYLLLYSGYRHKHSDGSAYTPLDAIREAFGKRK